MTCHFKEIIVPGLTLADVLERLNAKPELSDRRRRDLASAVRTVARLLRRNPAEVDADLDALRTRFDPIHPVQAGMSAKRLANVKSDLLAAITMTRSVRRIHIRKRPRAAEWDAFLATVEVKNQRWSLSRLAKFCSTAGIAPAEMSDAVLESFGDHLRQTQLAKDPDDVVTVTRQTWNGIVERSGADLPMLTRPPSRRFITRPLTEYPQSFQDDLEAWLRRQSSASMFDEEAPPKALRPTSLRNIEASIRQFAHALVEDGCAPETLTCLTDLVKSETYKQGLAHFVRRNGGTPPSWLANMAGHLVAIAKYHVKVEATHLGRLRAVKKRIAFDYDGLTDKNKARLSQFDNRRNLKRLIELPEHLLEKARSAKHHSSRQAVAVMHAVAIEILLACPMRAGNLAHLDIDRHLRWLGAGRDERLAIFVSGEEVKNGQPIEANLSPDCMRLVKTYLADWHHLLSDEPSTALFPMRNGGPRRPGHLSREMSRTIFRETGIEMHGHLFRHLAGKLHLDANPGEYETVRRLLGHRKLQTTTNSYAPLNNKRAVDRYSETLRAIERTK